MKENGIKSKRKPKWKQTTNSKHDLPIAPNLLNQDFNVYFPNSVWVGDITYNWTNEGWLYTAIVKEVSEDLGEAMHGIEISQIAPEGILSIRGW